MAQSSLLKLSTFCRATLALRQTTSVVLTRFAVLEGSASSPIKCFPFALPSTVAGSDPLSVAADGGANGGPGSDVGNAVACGGGGDEAWDVESPALLLIGSDPVVRTNGWMTGNLMRRVPQSE